MIYAKNLLSIFLFSMVLGSCVSKKQVTQSTESVKESTGIVTEKYRDTLFHTQKVSTTFGVPIPSFAKCADGTPISTAMNTKPIVRTQKNGNATAKVKIVHDSIFITAECDSIALRAQIKSEFEGQYRKESVKENIDTKKKTGTGFFGGMLQILIALAVGFVLGKLIRI